MLYISFILKVISVGLRRADIIIALLSNCLSLHTASFTSIKRFAHLLGFVAVAICLCDSSVLAGLTLCNGSTTKIYLAVAFKDHGRWYSRGWYNLAPGECVTPIIGPLTNRYYYYYAESATETWQGPYQFCVNPSNPFFLADGSNCERRGFVEIDVGNSSDNVQTLNISSERSNVPQGDWRFRAAINKGTALLSQSGWNFLLNNYVPHREPCKSINDLGGNMWVVQYHDSYVVGNLCQTCRGSWELIEYFTGQGTGDCDARDAQNHEFCFPRDAISLVKSHGLIDAIYIQGFYR